MGFIPKKNIYHLTFADPDMAGLEVYCRKGSMGDYLAISSLAALAGEDGTSLKATPEVLAGVNTAYEVFARSLVRWNVEEEDGNPVPATVEGLKTQEFEFVADIMRSWATEVGGIKPDLKGGLNSGVTFPAESIPMIPMPQSPSPES